MAVPSTPGEERQQSLRRTRWALAGIAVGGAVLATGAVAVLNGGGSAQAQTGPNGLNQGGAGQDQRSGDHDDDRWDDDDDDRWDDDDDDRWDDDDDARSGQPLTRQQIEQWLQQQQRQVPGGQQFQPQQQTPSQRTPSQQGNQGFAPQSRSRGS